MSQRERYARVGTVFGVLLILSTCVLLILLLYWNRSGERPPDISGPSGADDGSGIVSIAALLTACTSLFGFVTTTILKWREETREARTAELERQRHNLEIEKLRLELERLKAEVEQET
jgi:hypothetical protein